jgi:hypothetical protein
MDRGGRIAALGQSTICDAALHLSQRKLCNSSFVNDVRRLVKRLDVLGRALVCLH